MLDLLFVILFASTSISFIYKHNKSNKPQLDPEMEELLIKNGYKKRKDDEHD